jgi:hydroxyethylthiazole kinase-like uncharacterized protein yjeF
MMEPIATSAEVGALDRSLAEASLVDATIDRVGRAVAGVARDMLGGTYGRRVVALVGPGNNGRDAAAALRWLARFGAIVEAVGRDGGEALVRPRAPDLVIDGLFGTGLSRPVVLPALPSGVPILSIDVPSGVVGDTGAELGEAVWATVTAVVGALKPCHVLGPSRAHLGRLVRVLPELVPTSARALLATPQDALARLPRQGTEVHKWSAAVVLVAGSPGMRGSAALAARGALRAGSGMVRLLTRAEPLEPLEHPSEVVLERLERLGAEPVLAAADRARAMVIGPGLGAGSQVGMLLAAVMRQARLPLVIDADGLNALARSGRADGLLAARPAPTVLTPHAGEFARLFGEMGSDPLGRIAGLSQATGAVILAKGSPTVVAAPDGRVVVAAAGGPELASAGTGDVLAGVIGGLLARGMPAFEAAWVAAELHGLAGASRGMLVATELADGIGALIAEAAPPALAPATRYVRGLR